MAMLASADWLRLMEVIRRVAVSQTLDPDIRAITKLTQNLFAVQGKLAVRNLAQYKELFSAVSESLVAPIGANKIFAEGPSDAYAEAMQRRINALVIMGGKAKARELDVGLSFALPNPRANLYLVNYGANLVKGINATTRAYINSLMIQAQREGWSYNRTASQLISQFKQFAIGKPQQHIDSRAHLIAVTEAGNAYMTGQHGTLENLENSGIATEKSWSTMGDDKVSEGCRANAAVGWISSKETFPSGHLHPLRFPGCRCDMLTRISQSTLVSPKSTLDPSWTAAQRREYVAKNMDFTIQADFASDALRAQAVEEFSRQLASLPDDVVMAFLQKGKAIYADDRNFAKLFGKNYKSAFAFFSPGTNKAVFQLSQVGTAYQQSSIIHELGHFVHFNSVNVSWRTWVSKYKNKAFDRFTPYSRTDNMEGFAETFVAWWNVQNQMRPDGAYYAVKYVADARVKEAFEQLELVLKGIIR